MKNVIVFEERATKRDKKKRYCEAKKSLKMETK